MKFSGFTLIELLIVVAIIGILAAIAIPNFLNAQVRAKVSRCEADMKTIATALEMYRVDRNAYPPENYMSPYLEIVDPPGDLALPNRIKLNPLLAPIDYLASLPVDPFAHETDPLNGYPPPTYHYAALNDPLYPGASFFHGQNPEGRRCEWVLQSNGPDRTHYPWQFPRYNPTNGTISDGNILSFGP